MATILASRSARLKIPVPLGFAPARSGSRLFPAFLWAMAHAPLIFLLFRSNMVRALKDVAPSFVPTLWMEAGLESLFLALLPFLLTLPLAWTRSYRRIVPIVCGLALILLTVDSLVHQAMGFHINGFFLTVAMQPGAVREIGLSAKELIGLGALGLLFLGLEAWLGGLFIAHARVKRRLWPWLLLVLALELGARAGNSTMAFLAGENVRAAGLVLPLQVPVRFNAFLSKLTGRQRMPEAAGLTPSAGLPPGNVAGSDIHFTRRPDVIFILAESLRSDFFDEATMPHLTHLGSQGLVFDRHYSAASGTHFALFSLFFGLPATQRDATIGAGRTSLLFPALKANGYATRLIAASSVDWMDLKKSVFADVQDSLVTEFKATESLGRDAEMLQGARDFIEKTPADQPLFLFLFFEGTHFRYSVPPGGEIFKPSWDGSGSFSPGALDPVAAKNRARNSAYEVDRKIGEFLTFLKTHRNGTPLILFTGDHGEEFMEHGRFSHNSDVTDEQIHVPMVLLDEGVAPGRRTMPTGHIDLLPTILHRLGDTHDPALYSAGLPLTEAPEDRYILSTIGWEPVLGLVGPELKIRFYDGDGGFGGMKITDPGDRPLTDGAARFASEYPKMLQTLRGK